MATETLALFEHLEFDFLEEFDVEAFAPARRGEHEIITHQHSSERSCTATTRTSTASVQSRENSRTRSSFSCGFDRPPSRDAVDRFVSPSPRTRRRRGLLAGLPEVRRAGCLPRPARLDLVHRFHRREDDARRPRRVERLRSNRRRVLPRLRLVRSSRPGKRSRLPRSSPESKQAPEEWRCASRDALAVEKPIWMLWRQRLRHVNRWLARPPAGRRVVPVAPYNARNTDDPERHRVQGRSPHRRTQRGRSVEAIDARRDVQPPEWSSNERTNDGFKDCGLGTFAPRVVHARAQV